MYLEDGVDSGLNVITLRLLDCVYVDRKGPSGHFKYGACPEVLCKLLSFECGRHDNHSEIFAFGDEVPQEGSL